MAIKSRNASQISMLEEIKEQKILRALRGEVAEDKPWEAYHKYVEDLSPEEKQTFI